MFPLSIHYSPPGIHSLLIIYHLFLYLFIFIIFIIFLIFIIFIIYRQQELLYNAEFQIQQIERKVARGLGERSDEEKKKLKLEIRTKMFFLVIHLDNELHKACMK